MGFPLLALVLSVQGSFIGNFNNLPQTTRKPRCNTKRVLMRVTNVLFRAPCVPGICWVWNLIIQTAQNVALNVKIFAALVCKPAPVRASTWPKYVNCAQAFVIIAQLSARKWGMTIAAPAQKNVVAAQRLAVIVIKLCRCLRIVSRLCLTRLFTG